MRQHILRRSVMGMATVLNDKAKRQPCTAVFLFIMPSNRSVNMVWVFIITSCLRVSTGIDFVLHIDK